MPTTVRVSLGSSGCGRTVNSCMTSMVSSYPFCHKAPVRSLLRPVPFPPFDTILWNASQRRSAAETGMPNLKTLYDEDFVAWTKQQADALRATARGRTDQLIDWENIDWENLAEEIEDLGRSLRHELRSQIRRIVLHLVKLSVSPSREPRR